MILKVWFVFIPTKELQDLATSADELDLCEISVWSSSQSDKSGFEHSKAALENSFWQEFKAQLIYENETNKQKIFREACLKLGFSGSWSVIQTSSGGSADELIDSGNEAAEFLENYTYKCNVRKT